MSRVYIGLGSNMGDRSSYLSRAVELIKSQCNAVIKKKSSVIETIPVDYLDQDNFMNQIITMETYLKPLDLMLRLQDIEISMGRVKSIDKGPRIIDLDILLYDDLILDTSNLKIPHAGINKRKFILDHLIELEPNLVDPISKLKYSEVRDNEFCKKHK